jgi:uncharacterized repeat protein (TIGR04076 family)
MKNFLVEVEKVRGPCTRGYKEGDRFTFKGFDTPDGFCGGAYTMLFPVISTLRSGGRFHYEKNPLCKTNMACPDGGNVVFRITLVE